MKNRGEMTMGMIIAIALGVLVLVLLVFGVSTGFGGLWDRITQIGGTDNNVDAVAAGCEAACAAGNTFDYCDKPRTVSFGKGFCFEEETYRPIGNCESCKYVLDEGVEDGYKSGDAVPNCKHTSVSTNCSGAADALGISCSIC